MEVCYISTPLGIAKIIGDEAGISSIYMLDESIPVTEIIPPHLKDSATQLTEYFESSRKDFNLKLNPQGTDFQKTVWTELLRIPYGKTISYLELSKELGDVNAIRAVAAANGKNPLWIVVPCHRVIGSDGNLTGYAGGLPRKKALLELEGSITQMSLF
ncbi:methylated-DNA-[protein]-cysteine S-methyltransferase [Flavobacteriaceae bacterium MAR_2010_188]|nr:methylated-DNA-[protein]-cysteine S-methyltransferase [Flavobacteriaceae bacterium MAR_2010_188]